MIKVVRRNYSFLEFIVYCSTGKLSEEDVDNLAKFALAVLSIPQLFYVMMWNNIREHLLDIYTSAISLTVSNDKKDDTEDDKDKDKKEEEDKKGENVFEKLNDFKLIFGFLGYLLYKKVYKKDHTDLGFIETLLSVPELSYTLHTIGFLYYSPSRKFWKNFLLEVA